MCDRLNCDSPPEFHPVLMVRPLVAGADAIELVMGLKICLVCKSKLAFRDVAPLDFETKLRPMLLKMVKHRYGGSTELDETVGVKWIRLTSKLARQFAEIGDAKNNPN